MTAKEFWHSTPRKLAALSQVHADLNTPKKRRQKGPMTIDGVPVGKIPNSTKKGGGVGAPNAFVDQI